MNDLICFLYLLLSRLWSGFFISEIILVKFSFHTFSNFKKLQFYYTQYTTICNFGKENVVNLAQFPFAGKSDAVNLRM